tara:strand:- start:518 stop:904 length:387 start_codon:yes stop_codon:yes gene_type:complete
MKAYSLNENDNNMNYRTSLISTYFYDINKKNEIIIPAPPRQCLKIFGGSMSIHEFRKTEDFIQLNFPPIIQYQHSFDKISTKNYKFIDKEEANKEYKNTPKVKINPLKIKNKNDKTNTNLVNILGIDQ